MAVLSVRVTDRTRDQLQDLARAQGRTLSDLIRTILESAADYPTAPSGTGGEAAQVAPRSLSPYERQVLALQHRILAHVMPPEHAQAPTDDCARVEGDPEYQRERAQILESGYVGEYPDVFISVEPELPAGESSFVMDLLGMFRVVTYSIERLRGAGTDVDQDLERDLKFHGFDRNDEDESRLLDYVRHLVDEDHWSEMLPLLDRDHEHGNSHHPTRRRYQRLLDSYKAIRAERGRSYSREDYLLGLDELERLAASA